MRVALLAVVLVSIPAFADPIASLQSLDAEHRELGSDPVVQAALAKNKLLARAVARQERRLEGIYKSLSAFVAANQQDADGETAWRNLAYQSGDSVLIAQAEARKKVVSPSYGPILAERADAIIGLLGDIVATYRDLKAVAEMQ